MRLRLCIFAVRAYQLILAARLTPGSIKIGKPINDPHLHGIAYRERNRIDGLRKIVARTQRLFPVMSNIQTQIELTAPQSKLVNLTLEAISSENFHSRTVRIKDSRNEEDLNASSAGRQIWIEEESLNSSIAEAVVQGDALLVTPVIANSLECAYLEKVCQGIADPHRRDLTSSVVRIPTLAASERRLARNSAGTLADALPDIADDLAEKILKRVFDWLDTHHPSLVLKLFGHHVASVGLREAFHSDMMEFTPNEPAINVYFAGGQKMTPHWDHQALTVLVPLTEPSTFQGGGTGFWSKREASEGIEEPSLVLKPSAGSALIFSGYEAHHSGMPVSSAERVVLVCSLSAHGHSMGSESSLLAEYLRKAWQQSQSSQSFP